MKVLNPNNLPTAPITEFKALQGQLKFLDEVNYSKLKKSIEGNGFFMPVIAWIDAKGQKWLLDGHQRANVLTTEGWLEPVPYLEIKASTRKEAAEKLLHISSQYGTITQEGLDEFLATFEIDTIAALERVNFDAIFDFSEEAFAIENAHDAPEIEDDFEETKRLNEIQCPECGHHNLKREFKPYDPDAEEQL